MYQFYIGHLSKIADIVLKDKNQELTLYRKQRAKIPATAAFIQNYTTDLASRIRQGKKIERQGLQRKKKLPLLTENDSSDLKCKNKTKQRKKPVFINYSAW